MDHVLNVYGLPSLASEEDLADSVVVVIDVLRASTTIIHALESGAAEVAPFEEVEEAKALAEQLPRDEVILGGERGGVPIAGFDLGNSPDDYRPENVGNRTVCFTTTNGTKALAHCRGARRVLIGAFVNASAVVKALLGEPRICLVCAGTRGEYSRDDIMVAGLLVERLERLGGMSYKMNVQALTAKENWTQSFAVPFAVGAEPLEPKLLASELRTTLGGKDLVAIGLEADLLVASQIDRFHSVPELDLETFRIR